MATEITQRELRNASGDIMRRLDAGESFLVTRNGVPTGQLTPLQRRRFVPRHEAIRAIAGAPPIDHDQLRAELDRVVDQDPAPRG